MLVSSIVDVLISIVLFGCLSAGESFQVVEILCRVVTATNNRCM